MPVEVRVDLQEVARPAEVDAAADEVRIGDQVVDAGERLDEQQELPAVELPEHLPVQRGELRLVVLVHPAVLLVVAHDPVDRVERRERLGESGRRGRAGRKSS